MSGNGGGGFSVHDDAVFSKYLQFCGIGLRNAQLYERSQLEVRRNQVLLDLAGVIFQACLTKLVHTCITCFRFLKPWGSIIYLDKRPLDSYACPDQRIGKRAKSTNIYI